MKTYDVLAAGAVTLDYLISGVGDSLMKEDSILSEEALYSLGGDGLNTAVSLHRLGLSVLFTGCIGDDDNGRLLTSKMEKEGLSSKGLIVLKEGNTSAPVVLIERTGERHILRTKNSANGFLKEDMISDELLEESRHLHIGSANVLRSLDDAPLGRLFERAKKKGLSTSLDVSYSKEKSALGSVRYALANCDIFLPSILEAREITGTEDVEEMA
ncbi:MAG: carbohydrate kinase family protein, partial [Erysipelotrichaceae bacterium]|nr:carbohydrate kinase family protein [Erysipelotrichaceae bacterium]